MNKEELVEAITKDVGGTKTSNAKVLDATLNAIKGALKKGDKVTLIGFGTFQVKKRKERTGVNPQTKKKITIKAKNVPVFKAGKELRETVA